MVFIAVMFLVQQVTLLYVYNYASAVLHERCETLTMFYPNIYHSHSIHMTEIR